MNAQFSLIPSNEITVLSGDDTLHLAWGGGLTAPQFSNIDLNNDGLLDLFIQDRVGNTSLFLIQGKNGEYLVDKNYLNNLPEVGNWALLRDFNCDGRPDLFTSTTGGVAVFKNVSTNDFELLFEQSSSLLLSTNSVGIEGSLFVLNGDIPAIDDVDGDGDLDVLTFSLGNSEYLEFHKNLSVEIYGNCDSLIFELANACWGFFREDGFDNSISLYDSCQQNVPNPERRGRRHEGSTVTSFDMNDDGVTDLLIGDAGHTNIKQLFNFGTPSQSSIGLVIDSFPNNDVKVDIPLFPASYYVQVNTQPLKSILFAPNTRSTGNNFKGVHHYLNKNTASNPIFELDKIGFLQNDMIEVGEGSKPFLLDIDFDGDSDLIVTTHQYYDGENSEVKWSLYRNNGTAQSPKLDLVTDDWLNLSQSNIQKSAYPAFGDLNNDGVPDMILGGESGNLDYYLGSNVSNELVFSFIESDLVDINGGVIDVGSFSTPFLFDYDKDGRIDLFIGEKTGVINYYRNTGGQGENTTWLLVSENFGQVLTKEPLDFNGYSTPEFFEFEGNSYLISGSESGKLYLYEVNSDYNEVFKSINIDGVYYEGIRVKPAIWDYNSDGQMDLVMGNYRGGLSLYKGDDFNYVDFKQKVLIGRLFPNPSSGQFFIDSESVFTHAEIYNLQGEKLFELKVDQNSFSLETQEGVYLARLKTKFGDVLIKKLLVR